MTRWRAELALAGLLVTVLCACRRAPSGTAPDAASSPRGQADPDEPLLGPSTLGVIAGVLSFADPGVTPFSDEDRKDRELYEVLRSRGVPAQNLSLLLDGDARVAAIRSAVATQASRAGPTSSFLFYYAGHGSRDAEGRPYFLGYDTGQGAAGLDVAALGDLIVERFRGTRVVLMGDCCYSGTLKDAARKISASGRMSAVALTSADSSNLSTENWTFTQTVIDGLRGEPLADADADGKITLGELAGEVASAMKYRENQRHGFWQKGVSPDLLVAVARGKPGAGAGGYVRVSRQSGEEVARVREPGPRDSLVRFYHYNRAEDVRVPSSTLSQIRFDHHAPGTPLRVYWGGKLWDAKVQKVDGDFHFITYPGWPSYWDEWILSNRIAGSEGSDGERGGSPELVEVEWRGRWYPARVLRRSDKRALIHYDGYDSSWDEWVGPARIRRR